MTAARPLALLLTVLTVGQPVSGQARRGDTAPSPRAGGRKALTLERLYAWPKLEGTAPERPKWSDDGRWLAFLWNDEGRPFRDLWLWDTQTSERRRLTRLPQEPDEWTTPAAGKDARLERYAAPEAGLTDFQWSPDARRLAFELRGELYLAAPSGEEGLVRLTRTKDRESQPRFAPDGSRLAFVSGRELHVLSIASGERRQLTSGGGLDLREDEPARPGSAAGSYRWSPDGRLLAFESERDEEVKGRLVVDFSGERVTSRRQNWRIAREGNPRVRLGMVAADGGAVTWLTTATDDAYVDWEWSPDSSRVALLRVEQGQQKRHLDVIDVAAALESRGTDPPAGRPRAPEQPSAEQALQRVTRTVYSESDERWICGICDFVAWSPDGGSLAFSSERSGFNHLYLTAADGSTSAPRQLTHGDWEVTDYRLPTTTTGDLQPSFSRDGRSIYFTANRSDASERHLYRVVLDDGRVEALIDRKGVNVGVVSKDDRRVAFLYSSFADPWELYVKDVGGGAATAVTRSPLPELGEYAWPQPRMVQFPARDGRTLRALLFAPPGVTRSQLEELDAARARPAKAARGGYPVIDFVHGAGYAQAVLNRWGGYNWRAFQLNQYLAQQGYVVIDVDFRGSAGYGRDWRSDVYLHLGGKDMQDELAALDYLRTLSWADTSRAGVWGISYGGFMTLMLMFDAPGQFRAGSAWAAVSDWENYNREYTQQRLRTPEEQPEAYRRSSPLHHVAGLSGALQLQHGMLDDNVHFQDAAQLTNALVAAGKPFSQQFYPLENHVWARPETWVHSGRSLLEFFDRELRPAR